MLAPTPEGEEPKVPDAQVKYVLAELAPSMIRKMCRETSKDDVVSSNKFCFNIHINIVP
jgi:hypothetical protein